ncbi:MAG: hypothetical protein SOY45_00760 [Lachnospiraceae bacterium]|nr:hypothetical protein [Lachnospiraceae bacterium]MDY4068407.1 hypothetical protein [Lachnospiraceae bacterium]
MNNSFMDMVGTLTGNIEKAVIAIQDKRDVQPKEKEAVEAGKQAANGITAATNSLSKLNKMIDLKKTGSLSTALTASNGLVAKSARIFTVQFNPSELQFSGYGGGFVQKINFVNNKKADEDVTFGNMQSRITMTVKLIFDQVDPQDAFMSDKFTMSYTSVTKGVVKGVKKLFGKKTNSVQTQVEGFIGALRNENTREITFAWGKMCYTGILNRISSQYTMFSVTGEPIRAVVTMTMVCADENIEGNTMGNWEDQYNKAFGGGESFSLVNSAQKVGNLFNFNL